MCPIAREIEASGERTVILVPVLGLDRLEANGFVSSSIGSPTPRTRRARTKNSLPCDAIWPEGHPASETGICHCGQACQDWKEDAHEKDA